MTRTASGPATATGPKLDLARDQILAYRRWASGLDERLAMGPESLRRVAWAGLADSMPRAALLSIHARVAGTEPGTWEHPSLVQLWGPRFSAYVVAERDAWVFTLGRLPDDPRKRQFAEDLAARLEAFLDGRKMDYAEAGRALGVHPNMLRYAAPTGRVLLRWEGARRPVIWTVPPPAAEPEEARLELLRRYLHVFGPGTTDGFCEWAGIRTPRGRRIWSSLAPSLIPVSTPAGEGWILPDDEGAFRAAEAPPAPARLLPSGDTYFLLQGRDRELLVPDARRRSELWTPRVWPGALLVRGEVAGVWRRADADVAIETWRRLSPQEREAVEAEAASLPLPGLRRKIRVTWAGESAAV